MYQGSFSEPVLFLLYVKGYNISILIRNWFLSTKQDNKGAMQKAIYNFNLIMELQDIKEETSMHKYQRIYVKFF